MNDFYDTTYVLTGQPQFAGNYFYKHPHQGFTLKVQSRFFCCLLMPQAFPGYLILQQVSMLLLQQKQYSLFWVV